MTTQQNRIMVPPHRRIKVAIVLDPNTGQTELKIEQGQITHIQLIGLLLEHATGLYKRMLTMQQPNSILDGNGNNASQGNGGTNDAA